jgi:hypothetical protein
MLATGERSLAPCDLVAACGELLLGAQEHLLGALQLGEALLDPCKLLLRRAWLCRGSERRLTLVESSFASLDLRQPLLERCVVDCRRVRGCTLESRLALTELALAPIELGCPGGDPLIAIHALQERRAESDRGAGSGSAHRIQELLLALAHRRGALGQLPAHLLESVLAAEQLLTLALEL